MMITSNVAELQSRFEKERTARQRAEQALQLLAASTVIYQQTNISEVLQRTLELAHKYTQAEKAALLLYNHEMLTLETVASSEENIEISRSQIVSLEDSRTTIREVFRRQKPLLIDNVRTDLEWREKLLEVASDTLSELDVPILQNGEVIGIINMESTRDAAFSQVDQEFLTVLAEHAALAIQSITLKELRDLAEQRASAAEVMSAIGQFTFELTHRLGNELGLVPIYVEDIKDDLQANGITIQSVDQRLGEIRREVGSALTLIRGLREGFAETRKSAKTSKVTIGLSPDTLLTETLRSLPRMPENIQVQLDIDHGIALVDADQRQVTDILRNLVTNAIEAMPEGGTLTLRACNTSQFVQIQVEDTGIGIPREQQPRIFDLFYSTKGSTGFGLWSARRNALANGGDLTCLSETGKGIVFSLTLPMAK